MMQVRIRIAQPVKLTSIMTIIVMLLCLAYAGSAVASPPRSAGARTSERGSVSEMQAGVDSDGSSRTQGVVVVDSGVRVNPMWPPVDYLVTVLTFLVAILTVFIGVSHFKTFAQLREMRRWTDQNVKRAIDERISVFLNMNEFAFSSTTKTFVNLRDFYGTLRDMLSGCDRTVSPKDAKALSGRLDSLYEIFRIETQHVFLFSSEPTAVALAIRELQGMASPKSIKHLKDFIEFRRGDPRFESTVELAKIVIRQIERSFG
jgi:hypothetical protein